MLFVEDFATEFISVFLTFLQAILSRSLRRQV